MNKSRHVNAVIIESPKLNTYFIISNRTYYHIIIMGWL